MSVEAKIINYLRENGDNIPQNQIVDDLGVHKSTISRKMKLLEDKKKIKRENIREGKTQINYITLLDFSEVEVDSNNLNLKPQLETSISKDNLDSFTDPEVEVDSDNLNLKPQLETSTSENIEELINTAVEGVSLKYDGLVKNLQNKIDDLESYKEYNKQALLNLTENFQNSIEQLPELDNSLLEDFDLFEEEVLGIAVRTGEHNSNSYEIPDKNIKFRKSGLFNFWKLARYLRREGKL